MTQGLPCSGLVHALLLLAGTLVPFAGFHTNHAAQRLCWIDYSPEGRRTQPERKADE